MDPTSPLHQPLRPNPARDLQPPEVNRTPSDTKHASSMLSLHHHASTLHGPCMDPAWIVQDPASTLHRPSIDPASTLHGPNMDPAVPLATQYAPHMDPACIHDHHPNANMDGGQPQSTPKGMS
eukprot:gene20296-biopygen14622